MLAIHSINDQNISKSVGDGTSLLTTNKPGDYLWINPDQLLTSRYQGWFVCLDGQMYKIIDEIRLKNTEIVSKVENAWVDSETGDYKLNKLRIFKKKDKIAETLYLESNKHILSYELNGEANQIELILDIRKSYVLPQWNREYQFFEKDQCLIISYSDKSEAHNIFLAIDLDLLNDYKIIGSWIEKENRFDRKRQSPPYQQYVYRALSINVKSNKIRLGAGLSLEEAIMNVKSRPHQHIDASTDVNQNNKGGIPGTTEENGNAQNNFIKSLASCSLKSLVVSDTDSNVLGLRAGLPWFFQFWSRDEAISTKTLLKTDYKAGIDIIKLLMNSQENDGRILNVRNKELSFSESADSVGWLTFCLNDFIIGNQKSIYTVFPNIDFWINNTISKILKYHTNKDGLVVNDGLETWMDTEYKNDDREGACIEVQVLMLQMYLLAHKITNQEKYLLLEKKLLQRVREKFWTGEYLKDNTQKDIIRPNIFLAYYVYPKILNTKQWIRCFNYYIERLWLNWGGLASIDKHHSLFNPNHTGEFTASYHRGDSWFWINNIAAICMQNLNQDVFSDKIKKIAKASIKDFLWHRALGHSSELSSASDFQPNGSVSQAWSVSTYIDLLNNYLGER
ncbi:MAG: amylo-alpha-1,6-glucosidase [Candidatus Paceibacterota bacterium]|jgi:glycogen debranching enzyme